MNGRLIGINSFILSRSGGSAGVGFAIPSAQVSRVVASAVGGQTQVQRAWLGAKGNAVTGDIARSLGLTRPEGVLVSDVYRGSAADAAGLKAGDIILDVDGQPVNDEAGLRYRISLVPIGQTVPLTVLRNSRPADLRIKASAPPANPPRDERLIKGENPFSGAKVVNLSPAVADELGVDPFDAPKGVLVFSLESARTYAASAGLRPGDIIRAVNGVNIETTSQLDGVLKAGARGWRITIIRNGQQITAQFR
jgi:S1-C subfamily serine protease